MGEIVEFAERAWRGELEGTEIHPGAAKVGFEELDSGLAFMCAFSNVGIVSTEEGLVFLDTSSPFHADKLYKAVRRWSPDRVHTAVYTHGHVDHVFGLYQFEHEGGHESAATRVIAHEACVERFDRYKLMNGYNGVINQRQFGFDEPVFPHNFRYPDETVRQERTLEIGGETIHLFHDKGETDDHLWAWIPARKVIYTGDLFIWASPNCGNPQKAQRYPREWAQALRRMADLEATTLMPGHGPFILGADRVRQALTESATLLETIINQVLEAMNAGATLDATLHSVQMPDELLARPWLRPVYDDPRFIVRNLWRLYGGWYDGNPAHLLPAPERDLARALVEHAGGVSAMVESAEAEADRGRLDLACHLIEFAVEAEPDSRSAHTARTRIYEARRKQELSLMSKAIFGAAARDSLKKSESQ